MRNKKQASPAERRWMGLVAESGCLICGSPAQVHHLQCCSPRNNFLVIALCPYHHTGEYSIHASKRAFLSIEGSEMELLAKQIGVMA